MNLLKISFATLFALNFIIFIAYLVMFYNHDSEPDNNYVLCIYGKTKTIKTGKCKETKKPKHNSKTHPVGGGGVVDSEDANANPNTKCSMCIKSGLTHQDMLKYMSNESIVNSINGIIGFSMILFLIIIPLLFNIQHISEDFSDSNMSFLENIIEKPLKLRIIHSVFILLPVIIGIILLKKNYDIMKTKTKTIQLENDIRESFMKTKDKFNYLILTILIINMFLFLVLLIFPTLNLNTD